jgi:hypothetical protein
MNPANANNRGKWKAFEQIGFDVDSEAGRLEAYDSIMTQIAEQLSQAPADNWRLSDHGPRLNVDIIISGPSGVGTLTTVWQIDLGSTLPRLITNYLQVHR